MTPKFIVYKASAGSGKTFTLAAEYIALLLMQPSGNEFQHILAVTFTNLATAEMKNRIIDYLYGLANNLENVAGFKTKLKEILNESHHSLTDEEIQMRASNSLKFILHDYTHFRVETIDSFFQSVLRNMAHELGLNTNFQVELDSKSLVDRAVDRIVENLHDDSTDNFKKTIIQLIEDKISEGKSWNVSEVVKKFAKCIFDESFLSRSELEQAQLRNQETISTFIETITKLMVEAEGRIKDNISKLLEQINSQELNFKKINHGNWYEGPLEKMLTLSYVPSDMSDAMKTVLYEDSSKLLKTVDKKNPSLQAMAEATARLLEKALNIYTEERKVITTSQMTLRHINELRLLGRIEDECESLCEEHNQFSLSRTPVLLQKLVGENDSPFVFEKAGTQFRHIMIDEFQDTSQMQWQNFKVLLLNNLSSGGLGLLVGDVKQSIYRWRNGDWKILHNIAQEKSLPATPAELPLKQNFRSCKNIVDFNNSFFERVSQFLDESVETTKVSEIYRDVEQKSKVDESIGYVRMKLYSNKISKEPDYKYDVAKDMIAQIRILQELGVPLESIAILVRKRNVGTELIRLFEELESGITLISDEAFLLNASVSVQMIVNALRILVAPSFHDPVAMRYLCLHYLLDVMENPSALYTTELNANEILPEAFMSQLNELSQLPLYLLCERLYQIFNLSVLKGQDIYVFSFFDELQRSLRSAQTDIKTFLKAWDESISFNSIPSGNISGVRIITIHKSKGLQYHTVLLPSTDWEISPRLKDRLWCLASNNRFNALGRLPIDIKSEMRDSFFSEDYKEEQLQRRVDAINILYVAFTRAERNLLVWGNASTDDKTPLKSLTLSGDLLYKYICHATNTKEEEMEFPAEYSIGTPLGPDERKEESVSRMSTSGQPMNIPVMSYAPCLDFRQSNESQKFIRSLDSEDTDDQTYIDIGKIMHYVLSKIETLEDMGNVLEQCRIDGLIHDEGIMQRILKRLKHGFEMPLVRSWFSSDVKCLNEHCIVGHSKINPGKITHRPDRVVISKDSISVIDYKFARANSEHEKQVKGYMELLQQMHPEMKIEGYLWYVYHNRIDPVTL